MRSIRTERGEQFGRQLHAFGFQLLECLRHRVAVMENQQVGDQMIVLYDFQLIFAHIVFDGVGAEIRPLGEVVEPFALVLGSLDGLTQLLVADIFQQEHRAHGSAQFAKGEVQLVFPTGSAQLAQDSRRRNAAGLNRLRHLQHVRQVARDQVPIDHVLGKQGVDVLVGRVTGRAKPLQVFPVTNPWH